MLDQEFTAGTLRILREAVLAHATAAGLPEARATDVMLAVHELAANAVRHGGGTGRLRIRIAAGQLRCQITDPGNGSPRQVWRPLCLRTASYLTRFQRLIVDFLALFRRHITAV
jgi:anti-sigma regulatory factor (Ser/Thr protein kinase)